MWWSLVLLMAARTALAACPRLCECKWRSGKESAVCRQAGIDTLPRHLDPGTQLLDLSGNRLASLPDDAFSSAGLVNLQRIYLVECGLSALRRHTFRNQTNLVELDLSHNRLQVVPTHALTDAPELRELRLAGNPIVRIRDDAFSSLTHLVRLDLSGCHVAEVELRAFGGLEASLEFLDLDGNRLRGLRARALTSLRALHGLELAGNPWECTCELRPLRDWMLRRNVPATVVPECEMPPRLAAQPWDRLDLDEFACPPEIRAAASYASGYEGGEVTLACRVSGVPTPQVRWLRAGRTLANMTAVAAPGATSIPGVRAVVMRGEGQLSNLTIRSADVQDAGVYTCAAENRAGRAEASVTLSVERRAWIGVGGIIGSRAVLAGIAVATLFGLTSCLLALCAYEARKKRQTDRWNEQIVTQNRREDSSYAKIEAEQKEMEAARTMCAAVATVDTRKRGDYRNVPSHDTEDEAEAYNEEMETPTPTDLGVTNSWRPAPPGCSPLSPPAPGWNISHNPAHATSSPTQDLHIPRLTDYSPHDIRDTSTPEFGLKSKSVGTKGHNSNCEDNHQNYNAQKETATKLKLSTVARPRPYVSAHNDRPENDLSGSDSEKNYPDLIEMSALGTDSYLRAERERRRRNHPGYNFCTLPRKRIDAVANVADSRSPLLPESRYASSGGDSSAGGSLERRTSADLKQNRNPRASHRSASFLNLTASGTTRTRLNPSLPTSPTRDLPTASTPSAPSATPLLDLAGLRQTVHYRAADSPYKDDASYDFHASQLERFLEEYRSLREQLSKMKETRENLQRSRAGVGEGITATEDFGNVIGKGRPSVSVTAASSSPALPDSTSPIARTDWINTAMYRT